LMSRSATCSDCHFATGRIPKSFVRSICFELHDPICRKGPRNRRPIHRIAGRTDTGGRAPHRACADHDQVRRGSQTRRRATPGRVATRRRRLDQLWAPGAKQAPGARARPRKRIGRPAPSGDRKPRPGGARRTLVAIGVFFSGAKGVVAGVPFPRDGCRRVRAPGRGASATDAQLCSAPRAAPCPHGERHDDHHDRDDQAGDAPGASAQPAQQHEPGHQHTERHQPSPTRTPAP
jgi:hypothetical protein